MTSSKSGGFAPQAVQKLRRDRRLSCAEALEATRGKDSSAFREACRSFVLGIRRTRRETMPKIIGIAHITLDGVMQSPGVSL